MPRISIDLPDTLLFHTDIPVAIGDINYGGHLGNDAVLSLVHEARLQYFKSLGYSEIDIEGVGIVLADAVVVYRAEAFHGDALRVRVGLGDFNAYGFDMFYHLENPAADKEIARVKTGIVFFDYQTRKIAPIPAAFIQRAGLAELVAAAAKESA